MISHKCHPIHNLHGRHDGRQRINKMKIKPPARIVQDRHDQQAKQLLWGTIEADAGYNAPLQEQQIIRTVKTRHGERGKDTI